MRGSLEGVHTGTGNQALKKGDGLRVGLVKLAAGKQDRQVQKVELRGQVGFLQGPCHGEFARSPHILIDIHSHAFHGLQEFLGPWVHAAKMDFIKFHDGVLVIRVGEIFAGFAFQDGLSGPLG